jgi:hypothetical protein
MARKHSKSAKKRTHKVRRHRAHRGGGWGFTGPSSIPGTPGTVSNPQVFTGIGDCRAVQPGYDIPYSQYANSFKGLPGMSGGKRTRKQRGGRYGFFPEGVSDVSPNGAAWWAGTYPPVQRIACEGTSQNPLNPTHTGSSAPPGAADPNYYLKGGKRRKQRGGAQQLAPATYGVGNVDSMYYYAPTAGYANTASTWKDSVGAPVQIQVPFAARSMNQACLSTGGHPPLTGALQKGGKRRKTRRGGAFYGLPTSMNNLRALGSQLTGLFGMGAAAANAATGPEVDQAPVSEPLAEANLQPPAPPAPVAPQANALIPTSMPNARNTNTPAASLAPNVNVPRVNNAAAPPNLPPAAAAGEPNAEGAMPPNSQPEEGNAMGPMLMGGRKRRQRKSKKATRKGRKGRKH